MAEEEKCWTCEPNPRYNGAHRCVHTSTMQGTRNSGCYTWWRCWRNCNPNPGRSSQRNHWKYKELNK